MIASAVLIPDAPSPEPAQPPNGSLKRRQSSVSESSASSKRPRLETQICTTSINGETSPTSVAPSASSPSSGGNGQPGQGAMSPPAPPRRQSSLVEQDKSRNRRLFGALLGTLSQSAQPSRRPSAGTANKSSAPIAPVPSRREEIESRQRERLKRESHDIAEAARLKREKLDRERWSEQARWDEEGMRVRHRNMRATAGFLQTKTEPVLYYKPWKLREFEVDDIKRQVEGVEERISRKVEEFENQTREKDEQGSGEIDAIDSGKNGRPRPTVKRNGNIDVDDAPPNGLHESDRDNPATGTENSRSPQQSRVEVGRPASSHKSDEYDHGGEELEQGQEDDVIY